MAAPNLQRANIGDVLNNGLRDYANERDNVQRWAETEVSQGSIGAWADTAVLSAWGFKAATRTFHIAHSGHDVNVRGPFKGRKPTNADAEPTRPVPGSAEEADNLFDVSQIMAWLAKERRDLQEQVEWRAQIPGLMEALEVKARTLAPA